MEKIYLAKRCLQLFFACFLFTLFLLAPQAGYAQRTVNGAIRDAASGNVLAGASIGVKGGAAATVSDANGAFSISVPDNNATLVISYVGYATQEIRVGNQASISVSLAANSGDLAQVVVVGYGTQNKRDVTGSVKSLKTEDFNRGIINSPQQLLQGKVAGVNVTSASGEPGSIQGITIRGPGGVRTGSTPLFVVDGLPLDNSSTGGGDPLNFINPQDIASIDVLKDASATAIYGSRGANGVILVTTKRGKAGVSTLALTSGLGVSKMARKMPVLSAAEFRAEVPKLGGTLDDKGASTDWQDEVTRTAFTQDHNMTLSGGAEKFTYYASFGAQRQQGIIKKNQLDRYSGRFNATQKLLEDRLTLEVNLNVANTKNNRSAIGGILGEMLGNNPTYPAYGPDGKPAIFQNMSNPLLYLDLDKDVTTINRVIGSISPSLRIVKGLVYKLNFGIDNSTGTRHLQALPFAVPLRDGRLETFNTYNRNTLVENYLTYAIEAGNHDVSLLAGHSYQKIFVHGTNTSINRFPISGIEPMYNPGFGQELTLAGNRPGGYGFINELQSFFGRVNYQYNNKYLLTANFRADGSSKFGSENKYGYFPSFSLGWKISEEAFMEGLPFSNLKLRAGWGMTGNQEIPPKRTQALFNSFVSAGFSYPLNPTPPYPAGNVYARLANPFLQWESSQQTNIGLDFGFLNGALSGSIDRFSKTSNNILLQIPPTDPVQPQAELWANIEDMRILNTGWELDAEYRHDTRAGFNFSVGGNLTLIKNKVENSPYSVITSGAASGSGLTSATINGYINGQPIGAFLLKEFTGIDNNGVSTYTDLDKDGSISDKDRIVAGTALPTRIYSFYGTAGFKGLDLAVNFNGVAGNKIYDNTANSFFYKAKIAKSVNTTREAFADTRESINNAAPVSTRFLKDGAYLRLNNVSLGYNFNTTGLGIQRWVKSMRVSITGQNLFVITKYDGFDPEVNTDRTIDGISSYGIDYLSYPKARSLIFGVNVSF